VKQTCAAQEAQEYIPNPNFLTFVVSEVYGGHYATKYDGIHVINENDHANTGSKPEHGVTASCS